MSDTVKLIIEIPEVIFHMVKNTGTYGRYKFNVAKAIKDGIALDDVKAEIKEKCDEINYIVSDLPYSKHREIQDLLCEILESIGKAESEE